MNKIFKTGFFALVMLTILSSCKKEGTLNADLSIIDKNIIARTDNDDFLDQNYLNPYNIQVQYRFDRSMLALGKNLVPIEEDRIEPIMSIVRDTWIKTYEKVGGADFVKKIAPRQLTLVGSYEYNTNDSRTLGTASGGRNISLYALNTYDLTNIDHVKEFIHTVQHEYVHILNQNLPFQTEYGLVSKGGYEANWTQRPLSEAYDLGFITQYARVSPIEDFAEMASNMLMMGRVQATSIINAAPADGKLKLQKKEQLVVDYYKAAFNIDFYALQTAVQKEFYKTWPPVLANMLRPGIGYTSLTSNPSVDPNQSTEFLGIWSASKTAVAAIGGAGRVLNNFQLLFGTGNVVTVLYNYTNSAGSGFQAAADYTMTVNTSTGIARLTLAGTQPTTTVYGNMNTLRPGVAAINTYLTTNQFKIDWFKINNPGEVQPTIGTLGGFFKSTDADSYFYGAMGF